MRFYLIFFILLTLLNVSFSISSADHLSGKTAPYFSLGSGLRLGSIQSEDATSLKKISLLGLGVDFMGGITFSHFVVGASLDYFSWSQLTDPSSVGDANVESKMLSISPVLGYRFSSVELFFKYLVSSKNQLNKKDVNGNELSFTSPKGSTCFQLRYLLKNNFSIGLEYLKLKYTSEIRGSTTSTYSNEDAISFTSYGLMLNKSF